MALVGCLPIDFITKEIAFTRYLKRQVTPEDYWPPLINLNIHKLNEHTYHTESHANYVFGNSFSTSNTINEIRKTLQKKLYMKWYG